MNFATAAEEEMDISRPVSPPVANLLQIVPTDVIQQALASVAQADVHVDARLVLFTLIVGVTTTLLFAVAPALEAARSDPAGALARGGRSQAGGRHLLQRLLVGTQVALAIVLLSGAGLLLRKERPASKS